MESRIAQKENYMIVRCPSIDVDASARHSISLKYLTL